MFFSSGTAQTNGGGSLCMVTYSLDRRLLAALVAIEDEIEKESVTVRSWLFVMSSVRK